MKSPGSSLPLYSAGASYSSPSSSADVKVSPLLTTVPSPFVTVPNIGSPVTVIVRLSPSTSVGAVSPKDVSVLSSSTVMLLLFHVVIDALSSYSFVIIISV